MNGPAHQLVAGFATGVFIAEQERQAGLQTAQPLLAGTAAAFLTKLPDILEPATSPMVLRCRRSRRVRTLVWFSRSAREVTR